MSQYTITTTKLPNARMEIHGTIPSALFDSYRDRAINDLSERVEISGFRPGKAPKEMVAQHVGNARVLEEMAGLAIADAYPTMITEQKIEALGRPTIIIKKMAPGNDLEFTATTDVMPTVTLGNYKKIAKEIFAKKAPTPGDGRGPDQSVGKEDELEADVEKTITELRKMRAHQKMHEDGIEHESHNHHDIKDSDLPPLDDAFAQSLGKFATLAEFRAKIKENLQSEREMKALDERRARVMDEIIKASTIDMPDILVEAEIEKIQRQFEHDIAMGGQSVDEYLKHIKKTIDDLRATWRPHAEERVKIQLIVDTISEKEKLVPADDEVSAEVSKIMDQYKDHKDISEPRVKAYVTQMLINKKVIDFLEKQSG